MTRIVAGREKEYSHELARAEEYLDDKGREMPSGVPMAPPIGYRKQPSLHEQIREMIRGEKLRMEAEAAGYETFEEADDFSLGDDDEPQTSYQNEAVFEGDVIPPPEPEPKAAPPEADEIEVDETPAPKARQAPKGAAKA